MFKHIPNILTIIRMFLVPLFPFVYFSDMNNAHLLALGIFVIAGVTDVLDGFLARRYKLVTIVGTVLDPLADKLMLIIALISLYIDDAIPIPILVIVLIKETMMIASSTYMYFHKERTVIPANIFGKMSTVLFSLAVFITIVFPQSIASMILISIAVVNSLIAMASYIHHYFKRIKPEHHRK